MDPFTPPITRVPGITTDTSAADAEIARRRLNDAFNLFPPDTILGNQQRRDEFGHALRSVTAVTVVFIVASEFLPGRIGELVAGLLAGGEKDPNTGKFVPKVPIAGNYAPSPIGFAEPNAYGIRPNFYLPAGSTNVIPRVFDRLGLGLPEQRAEDAAAHTARLDAQLRSETAGARQAVANETEATLRGIIAGGVPLTRSAVVIATTPVPLPRLQLAAEEELLRRTTGPGAPVAVQLDALTRALEQSRAAEGATLAQTQAQIASLDQEQARINAQLIRAGAVPNPFAGILGNAIASGGFAPERIEPVNDAARRNQSGATGIRRMLVSERADP